MDKIIIIIKINIIFQNTRDIEQGFFRVIKYYAI